jgi:glycine/D-amino acid oxidase-like deaminating enzyme
VPRPGAWQHGAVHSADVVVIGGGIAGASAAYELAAERKVILALAMARTATGTVVDGVLPADPVAQRISRRKS